MPQKENAYCAGSLLPLSEGILRFFTICNAKWGLSLYYEPTTRETACEYWLMFYRPPSNFWRHPLAVTALGCSNIGDIIFSTGVINTALELVVALLPVPYILSVKMDRRQRLSIMSLLCLGVLVAILGVIRCRFVWLALISGNDVTWWAGPHWAVSEVENNVAIVSYSRNHIVKTSSLTDSDLRLYASFATSFRSTILVVPN
jgi:hypothetical protein